MKSGDRIIWKNKHGEYIGAIRHTYKHRGSSMVLVWFDGNNRASRVPICELSVEPANPPDGGRIITAYQIESRQAKKG